MAALRAKKVPVPFVIVIRLAMYILFYDISSTVTLCAFVKCIHLQWHVFQHGKLHAFTQILETGCVSPAICCDMILKCTSKHSFVKKFLTCAWNLRCAKGLIPSLPPFLTCSLRQVTDMYFLIRFCHVLYKLFLTCKLSPLFLVLYCVVIFFHAPSDTFLTSILYQRLPFVKRF